MPAGNQITNFNNPVLTSIYLGYEPLEMAFIANQVMPAIKVNSVTGDLRTVVSTANDFLRLQNDLILGESGTPEIKFDTTLTTGWNCEIRGLQMKITKSDGMKYNPVSWSAGQEDLKRIGTRLIKKGRMIGREFALASALTSTSVITQNTTLAGASQFSDPVNSDPVSVVRTAVDAIYSATGMEANTIIMGRSVFRALQIHPAIKKTVGSISGTGTVPVLALTKDQVAMALGVSKILIGASLYEQSKLNVASSKASIWGKDMIVAYINPNPSPEIFEYSLGYNFYMAEPTVDDYSILDPRDTVAVRVEETFDDVIVNATSAYLVKDAVA